MKKWYGVGSFIGAVCLIVILNYAFSMSHRMYEEKETKKEDPIENQTTQKDRTVDATSVTNGFYLEFQDNYVVIFLSDHKTIYENTDIEYDDLPENLQREITAGKMLKSEEELYSFLENYSS